MSVFIGRGHLQSKQMLALLFTLLAFMYIFLGVDSFFVGSSAPTLQIFFTFAAMLVIGALGCHLESRPFYRIGVVLVVISFVGIVIALQSLIAQANIASFFLVLMIVTVTNILLLFGLVPLSTISSQQIEARKRRVRK